jgi:hypothetical protein
MPIEGDPLDWLPDGAACQKVLVAHPARLYDLPRL